MAFSRISITDADIDKAVFRMQQDAIDVLYDDAALKRAADARKGVYLELDEKNETNSKRITTHAEFNELFDAGIMTGDEKIGKHVSSSNVSRIKESDNPIRIKKDRVLFEFIRSIVDENFVSRLKNELALLDDKVVDDYTALDKRIKNLEEVSGTLDVYQDNEFFNVIHGEIKKYNIIAEMGIVDVNKKRLLHNLSIENLASIHENLKQAHVDKQLILGEAYQNADRLKSEKIKIDAKNGMSNPECEVYREIYQYICSGGEEVNLDNEIEKFRNPYTKKIYHEPFRSHAKFRGLEEKEEAIAPKNGSVEMAAAKQRLFEALKKIQENFGVRDIQDMGDFCLQNAMSESAYKAAVEIERKILDMEDAITDENITANLLDVITKDLNDLQTEMGKLKGLVGADQAQFSGSMLIKLGDAASTDDQKNREPFFKKFYEKMQGFSVLLEPLPKRYIIANEKEVAIDDAGYNKITDDEIKKQYTEVIAQEASKGRGFWFFRVGKKEKISHWATKDLDVYGEDHPDALVATDKIVLDDPAAINSKLRSLLTILPRAIGLKVPENPESIAVSIALLRRLKDSQKDIEDAKSDDDESDARKKKRIAIIVETTEKNIKKGIGCLKNIGQASFFMSMFDNEKQLAEEKFADLTRKMRGEAGDVPEDAFVSTPKNCNKDGGEEKDDIGYKRSNIFNDNDEIYSIYSKSGEKLIAECRGARHFVKNSASGEEVLDLDKAMECAAREVEALRAKIEPPNMRNNPRYGLILTRGAAMTDEYICAIKAYCKFNGYPPVRAVLNGGVKVEFNGASYKGFEDYLKISEHQLKLEQKLGIMLGKMENIQERNAQVTEARELMIKSDQAYEHSKILDHAYTIRPSH